MEHKVTRLPKGVVAEAVLFARGSAPSQQYPDGTWEIIAQRAGSKETLQHALEATLTPKYVFNGHITLRAVVWFRDGNKNWEPPNSATLIEYSVASMPSS